MEGYSEENLDSVRPAQEEAVEQMTESVAEQTPILEYEKVPEEQRKETERTEEKEKQKKIGAIRKALMIAAGSAIGIGAVDQSSKNVFNKEYERMRHVQVEEGDKKSQETLGAYLVREADADKAHSGGYSAMPELDDLRRIYDGGETTHEFDRIPMHKRLFIETKAIGKYLKDTLLGK